MYTPVLPGNSLSAWIYLKDSRSDQLKAFSNDSLLKREATHFAEGIAEMSSVNDLMGDYLSLKVALGAHGLEEDLPNRYFVRQVIEQGIDDPQAFANRLGDARYEALAKTFADLGLTGTGDLADQVGTVTDGLRAAVQSAFGDAPMQLAAAGKLDQFFTLGLAAADTPARQWTRLANDSDLTRVLSQVFGTSPALSSLGAQGRGGVLAESAEFLFGTGTLTALTDPDNTYALADTYLGTNGAALSDAFSYGGMAVEMAAIFGAHPLSQYTLPAARDQITADRWEALRSNTALRDVLAQAFGVDDGLDALSAEDQIAALKAGTEAVFGSSDFALFASQANLTQIGDLYLAPAGTDLAETFTLGAFVSSVKAVRDQGATVEETWESVLGLEDLQADLITAYDLPDSFANEPLADRIRTMMAETESRFGSTAPDVFNSNAALAQLSGMIVDARIADITDAYMEQSFRVAVGEVRPELRVAMSVAEELQAAFDSGGTDNGRWYRVLGSNVLREAFETAFGLDSSFAQLDLDAQVKTLQDYSQRYFGTDTVDGFLDDDTREALITRYLARAESGTTTASAPVLSLFGEASSSTILATLYSGT